MTGTIFALSSAPGRAGVAVIRVSGSAAAAVYRALSRRALPAARRAVLVRLFEPADGVQIDQRATDGGAGEGAIDEGLAFWFPGPHSYTGEDSVEFQVHGGVAVVAAVLDAIGRVEGTRLAEPGEFTRRAFVSGKIDLTEAEGVIDLIDAETTAQRRQALRQAGGALGAVYDGWRDRLVSVLAHFEAVLDFPDEDLPDDVIDQINRDILRLEEHIAQHLDDNRRGERLRNGVRIAIIGPPNAGKSSLLNMLADRDVAIVSEVAGTTRDVIETHLDLAGLPVTVADTAGIRDSEDAVEAEGVRRARRTADEADLKVLVLDSQGFQGGDGGLDRIDSETIVLMNKIDLGPMPAVSKSAFPTARELFGVSVRTGVGLDEFLCGLTEAVRGLLDVSDAPVITRVRHRASLEDVRLALQKSQLAPLPELAAEDIRLAVRSLGRITGSVDVEDLLDVVFRDFCIGK
ncbi:MAG: tRNA uridine-5-carboxymethylaminomethyl(34) synthesis GTPase MnmE [Rhodospirillaceae bacterium]|nr:tRNA uridine-5-carboxymethylaminomethyl(34) synthesis GTPase MnmE [Rhodospirillaceae bacterium]MBT5666352.1 tRNA uridine-5-carboxymethylaminomethyl(34) synthesis GTPase MnmE [Rhodospirillaceae bacterium]MBT5812474.1 tRNA uridine-5-carboxymethylaminomethyl(34) synthesis GTPase MnmE [Rhodospirillaceae bacterium]